MANNTNTTAPISEQTSSQNINRIIGNVKRSAGAYNTHVQDAIVAIIEHSKQYNDCTGAARLLGAMPRSNRRQLAVDHFQQYSPIAVRKNPKSKLFQASYRKPDDAKYNKFDIDGVRANNWWERENADKLPDVVDFDSIRSGLLKYFESAIKKADNCNSEAEKDRAVAYLKAVRTAASELSNPATSAKVEADLAKWDEQARKVANA